LDSSELRTAAHTTKQLINKTVQEGEPGGHWADNETRSQTPHFEPPIVVEDDRGGTPSYPVDGDPGPYAWMLGYG